MGGGGERSYDPSDGERQPHRWGYTDTRFEFDGPRSVRMTGSRYPLAGHSLPHFLPFVESVLGFPIRPEDVRAERPRQPLPAPRIEPGFLAALEERFPAAQRSLDDRERLVHSHGQLSVDEVYRVLYRGELARVVDLVVWPQSEDDVRELVRLAGAHRLCLVPYGGGTNVSAALAVPAGEARTVVSVDMRRMNRVLHLDEENRLALVEAGISGKDLEQELARRGYTSGHDPDSIEFSTLGGWIATNASGMKKNRYGNIEDIVREATLITALGAVETRAVTPRNSAGVPPRAWLFGSEGNLGIITKAVLQVHRRPETREYGSLVFRSFAAGVGFLRELRATGVIPASIRLVNNNEFRFGQALKPAASAGRRWLEKLQKHYLFGLRGFRLDQVAACTVLMEGSAEEVRHQRRTLFGLARRHGAISGGAAGGRRGYMLTFAIAYIRDFFSQFEILGETFETSVPWSRICELCAAVEQELKTQCQARGVAGRPYLSYRVTQTYHTGVCIYFTMGFSGRDLAAPERSYHEIEARLRQTILDHGGSLSHHHGVGKIRSRFLPQVQSEAASEWLRRAKQAVDPDNVFAIGNGVFAERP